MYINLGKLCVLLIISNFPVTIQHGRLPLVKHNLYANLEKNPEICKDLSKDLVNEHGNSPRRVVDLVSLTLKSYHCSFIEGHIIIGNENLFFYYYKGINTPKMMAF